MFDLSTNYILTIKKLHDNVLDTWFDLSSNIGFLGELVMFRWIISAISLLFILTGSRSIVLAEDVFITRTGRFYYSASSPFIKTRATIKMPREDAEARGYKPSKSYLKAKQKESRTPEASLQQQY